MGKGKKLIALLLAALTASGVFAGCSGSGGSAKTGASQASEKKVILTWPCIWVGTDTKAASIKELVNSFNEQYSGKIQVNLEDQTDYQAYRDKIKTSIAAGTTPDIFTFDTDVDLMLKSSKLADLTQQLNQGWKDDFVSGATDNAARDGKIRALPFEMACTPVMYNKTLLQKAGYTEFPKTYDDLWVLCDKLKAAGITPFSQMTGENAWTTMLWYSQLVAAIGGKDVYSDVKDTAFVKAADVIKKMYTYTTKDAVGAGAAVSGGHFLAGETAIYMNGPWYIKNIQKNGKNNLYDNLGIAPAPVYKGGKGEENGYIGGVQAYVCVGATDDEAKLKAEITFLKYLTDPENVGKIAKSSGSLFYVKISDDSITDPIQKEINTQMKAAPYIVSNFQSQSPTAVANDFPQALSSLVLGELTSQQFVDELNSKR